MNALLSVPLPFALLTTLKFKLLRYPNSLFTIYTRNKAIVVSPFRFRYLASRTRKELEMIRALRVPVWESVPEVKICGQPIRLRLGAKVGFDKIFQKPFWITSLTVCSRAWRGVHLWPMKHQKFILLASIWKCHKTPLVNCATKGTWPWTLL